MSEDGVNSGARDFGRLCLALIPWALGIGVSVWLGVWAGLHEYHQEILQEQRAAIYVGAQEKPKSKMQIEVVRHDCSKITHADLDGSHLVLYAENDCHEHLGDMEWDWQQISPNGTVLKQGYENGAFCAVPSEPNDKAECRTDMGSEDSRAATLRIWTKVYIY